jgi:hypothetical protein
MKKVDRKCLVENAAIIPACTNNVYAALDPLGKDIQSRLAAGKYFHHLLLLLLITGVHLAHPCRNILQVNQQKNLQQKLMLIGHHKNKILTIRGVSSTGRRPFIKRSDLKKERKG